MVTIAMVTLLTITVVMATVAMDSVVMATVVMETINLATVTMGTVVLTTVTTMEMVGHVSAQKSSSLKKKLMKKFQALSTLVNLLKSARIDHVF